MPTAICPYCTAALKKTPLRKTKCPHCGKAIFVKRPFGEPRGTKVLMTKQRANAEETKWQNDGEKKSWIQSLASIGVNEDQFTREHRCINAKDNGLIAAQHIVTTVLSTEKDLHRLKMATGLMARIVDKQGGNSFEYRKAAYRLELERLRPRSYDIEIRKTNSLTNYPCNCLGGRKFSIDKALDEMPLPCSSNCTCWYKPIMVLLNN